jgi:hypothetical protein
VDVSDWDTPGSDHVQNRPAKECSEDEVKEEVWRQLKDHLNNDPVEEILRDANRWDAFVDPAVRFRANGIAVNHEPLLINTKGSWDNRPEATTKIKNLFLASDYVRTNTDLATMEGATEAARRAVNGILDASHSDEDRCTVRKLWQPPFFDAARMLDAWRFDRNQPQHVDLLDPAMPPDFPQRPDAALERFEKQMNDPAGPRPPGWPNAAPPLRRRRRGDPRPVDPILRRPGDPPRPSWVRVPPRPPGR